MGHAPLKRRTPNQNQYRILSFRPRGILSWCFTQDISHYDISIYVANQKHAAMLLTCGQYWDGALSSPPRFVLADRTLKSLAKSTW